MEKTRDAVEVADDVVGRHHYDHDKLIGILQDIQQELNWLPREALNRVASRLNVPLSRVFGIASFYKAFSLVPRGRHVLQACTGTACHVRGGPKVLSDLKSHLDVEEGETTEDGRFTLEVVRCLGCCSLAPVVMVDDDFHGLLDQDDVVKHLSRYE